MALVTPARRQGGPPPPSAAASTAVTRHARRCQPGAALRDAALPRVPLDTRSHSRRGVKPARPRSGRSHRFTATDPSGATRTYKRFSAAAYEEGISRIYCGIHFRTAMNSGFEMGRLIARQVDSALMQPLDDWPGGAAPA